MESHRSEIPFPARTGLPLLAAAAVASLGAGPLAAQDIERIAPRTGAVDGLDGEAATRRAEEEQEEPVGGSTESVGAVRGIRLVARPGQVRVDDPPSVEGVVVASEDLVVPDGVKEALGEFVGGPLSLRAINEMNRAAVLAYREAGLPIVDVAFPEQNVSEGVLQMVVVIGRAGEISVEGNRWFDDDIYLRSFRTAPSAIIYEEPILADLRYLNDNPYRNVTLLYTPGEDFGETDLVLEAEERRPWTVYAGYEDTGNTLLGEDRLIFGADWGNAFGLDHRFAYQYTTTTDFDRLDAHSATYRIPFPRTRHELRLLLGYVETDVTFPVLGVPLTSGGESSQASAEYAVPLPGWGGYEHEIAAGFDFKSTNNNLEFGGATVTDNTAEIFQFSLSQTLSKDQPFGRQRIRQRLVWAPGDLSNHNSDAVFQGLRALGSADYVYWTGEVTQSVDLPRGFEFVADVGAQLSTQNLLPSETLVMGGVGSVRGFAQNIVRADRGAQVNLELYSPPFRPLERVGSGAGLPGNFRDEARLFVFYDYAVGGNVDLLPGESDDFQLGGAGVGVEMNIGPHASAVASYGWQVLQEGFVDDRHSRWHVSALVRW